MTAFFNGINLSMCFVALALIWSPDGLLDTVLIVQKLSLIVVLMKVFIGGKNGN